MSFFNFEAVTTFTLARWLKCVLSLSRVDSCFKAHSYRNASTSCAYKKGVSIRDIMETANWTSARTFYKHYHKEVDDDNTFANAILNWSELLLEHWYFVFKYWIWTVYWSFVCINTLNMIHIIPNRAVGEWIRMETHPSLICSPTLNLGWLQTSLL